VSIPDHIERILSFPPAAWSDEEHRQVRETRALLHTEQFALVDRAEREERNLTSEEAETFERLQLEFARLAVT
jgi:hypothetical protein